jgi:hypothetical protein
MKKQGRDQTWSASSQASAFIRRFADAPFKSSQRSPF